MIDGRARLLWVDLETTGLDPENDHILAVGVEVTDARAEQKFFSGEWVVLPDEVRWEERMSAYVRDMHLRSGLLERVYQGYRLGWVLSHIEETIRPHAPAKELCWFAGSTLHFDLAFLDRAKFRRRDLANYRVLDVSAFKVVRDLGFNTWIPPDDEARKKHTPLEDIHASQLTFRQAMGF